MTALDRKLDIIRRMGGYPIIKEPPKDAVTFDCMIVVYLDANHKRLYQVHFWDTKTEKIIGTF